MLASDLHVHLDGSMREATVVEMARAAGLLPTDAPPQAFLERLRFRRGMSLASCLDKFQVTVGLLQTGGTLFRVARELARDCYVDGVRHVEIRFCPTLHTRGGLSPEEVVESVLGGVENGVSEATSGAPDDRMSARVIVSVLEGMTSENAGALVDLAARYSDSGIVGVDLAGDETLFDASVYESAFARAADSGLGVTVHAGEGRDAAHIRDAVTRLRASRIGHGVSAASDPEVAALLADNDVTVEVCLSSNLHTGAVETLKEHPLQALSDAGVPVVLCTDNTFFSATTLSREYELARSDAGACADTVAASMMRSAEAAFLPAAARAELIRLYSVGLGPAGREDPTSEGTDE
jgi:adenosine deaminase